MIESQRHRQIHWRTLMPAPPGLVAVYVDHGECLTDPIVAFGIRDTWESPRYDGGDFDPDRDQDFDSAALCLVIDERGLGPVDDITNCIGVFPLADLTSEKRTALVAEYERYAAIPLGVGLR
jgi:hypothetical protein